MASPLSAVWVDLFSAFAFLVAVGPHSRLHSWSLLPCSLFSLSRTLELSSRTLLSNSLLDLQGVHVEFLHKVAVTSFGRFSLTHSLSLSLYVCRCVCGWCWMLVCVRLPDAGGLILTECVCFLLVHSCRARILLLREPAHLHLVDCDWRDR
jgi:hypothetical protein